MITVTETLVWTDSLWVKDNDIPVIILYGRDYNDRTRTVKTLIRGFEPYFYAPATIAARHTGTFSCKGYRIRYTTGDTIHTDALGRSIRKVTVNLPSDVPQIRDNFEWTDEADILFDKRYLTDTGIKYAYEVHEDGSVSPAEVNEPIVPRIVWFDIEVLGETGSVPQPSNAKHPIVSIQVMDNYSKKITIFTYGVPSDQSDDQVYCGSEQELLVKFCHFISELDPDILSGWYTNGFDLPYIINRAKNLGISLKGLCRTYTEPDCKPSNGGKWFIRIPGRQCLDLLDAFKKYYAPQGQLDAYDLKSVISNKDVMEDSAFQYHDYGPHIQRLFHDKQWDTFLQYCRYDVIALDTIDTKLKLVGFYEHLRMIAGVKIEETLMNSRVIESLIMRAGIKPMPTKSNKPPVTEGFEGALVLTPPIGIHNNVGVVDLTALYPNIMVGFNISPDIDGVVPNTLKVIMEEREKLRRLKMEGKADSVMKNKETVLKYLANSFYGVIGWPRFRLYNQEQAATVTRIGRDLNIFLQEVIKDAGYKPIYGDTDSVFATGIPDTDAGLKLQDYANSRLAVWSKEHASSVNFTLKFEKLYRRIVFKQAVSGEVAKKRYAGHLIWKDGQPVNKLDFTGIELKRSDQSHVTKDLLRTFLVDVLQKDDPDAAITSVRTMIRKILDGSTSIHQVSIPKGVNNEDRNDPWSRGIKLHRELFNNEIPQGIKPRLIYIKGDRKELCIYDDMDEEDILGKVQIDWPMCMQKTVEKKMRTFVESIGFRWDQIIGGQRTLC